jgi:hypothetical protein
LQKSRIGCGLRDFIVTVTMLLKVGLAMKLTAPQNAE